MSEQNQAADGYVDPMQAAANHFDSVRGDATKAVEEALKGEAEPEAAPVDDPEAPDEPAVAKDEPADDDEGGEETKAEPTPEDKSIARILKQREKAATEKTELQKMREEARAAAEEARKAREELTREREEIERDKAKLAKLKDLKNAPDALKELGWDPDEFVTAAANANTPQGRLEAMVRKQAEVIAELKSKAEGWERQGEEQKAEAKKRAEAEAIRNAENAFAKTALDAEKYPALHQLYGDEQDVLLFKAHDIARKYRAATGGEEASFEQIADYLNEQAQAKLGNGAKKQDAPKNGKAPPAGRPPGKRTLTNADASERRSVPAVDKTDDLDEMRRRARAAAEKAIRESA